MFSLLNQIKVLTFCLFPDFDHLKKKEPSQPSVASKPSITPQTWPICISSNEATKQFVHEHEVRSSMTLDLNPGQTTNAPCKTVLTAPESNVFIVRLHRINAVAVGRQNSRAGSGSGRHGSGSARSSRNMDSPTAMDGVAGRNTTRSCPLSIVS